MARTHVITNAKTGERTIVPFTAEEEAEYDARAVAAALETPLAPYQFHAMVEIIETGGRPLNITAIINALPAGAQRAVARAKYERATAYHRNDPLVASLSAAAGITSAEMDAYWQQAVAL